ncbi:MAG: YHS domain-containing protein [Actinomycetota bacterium]|nr:YHS domain-containing protein [Actinomycetota bacterium]
MQVERQHAPASAEHNGEEVYFCSEGCQDRFVKDPERHRPAGTPPKGGTSNQSLE